MKKIISILLVIMITSFYLKAQNTEKKLDSIRLDMRKHLENKNVDSLSLVIKNFRHFINNLDDKTFINYVNKHSISDDNNIKLNNKLEVSKSKSQLQSLILLILSFGGFIYLIRYTDKKSRNKQIQKLKAASKISSYELNLRKSISETLHDDIGGSIAAFKMKLINDKTAEEDLNILDKIYNDVRALSRDLDTQTKLHTSLKNSIQDLIDEMCSNFEKTSLNIFPESEINTITNQQFIQNTILTLKELITNVINHAQAKNISIDISKQENNLVILVQDDGIGFDFEKKEGLGLKSIRNRCVLNDGDMFIDSNKQNGTTVTVNFKIFS
ncbi:hypothetical protein OA521_03585 [bacterium]|nr:hypothetical protein [bacterium]